jgi:uncharacterized protein GlcG (DUF336 family)
MFRRISTVVATAAVALAAGGAAAQASKPTLTLATAQKMAAACIAKAEQEGWRVIVAIVDDGGNLKYFHRMDNAFLGSIQIAQLKAATSAQFPFSTKRWGEITQMVKGLDLVPGTVTFEGGLPIIIGGQHAGAIGVSGATGAQDGECAQASLDAVADELK